MNKTTLFAWLLNYNWHCLYTIQTSLAVGDTNEVQDEAQLRKLALQVYNGIIIIGPLAIIPVAQSLILTDSDKSYICFTI